MLHAVEPAAIVELRQYTLLPGQRDVLIDLFEAHFVEGQEDVGMQLIGTFRDLDDPAKFVWLRGFASMEERRKALTDFYFGPVWQAHGDAANATMVDSDDVLLLRPARPESGLPFGSLPSRHAPPRTDAGVIGVAVFHCERAAADELVETIEDGLERATASNVLCTFVTEHSENTFPALPVRRVNVVASVIVTPGSLPRAALQELSRELALSEHAQLLRLEPTRRSRLAASTLDRAEAR